MNLPFEFGYRITQRFGLRPDYYKQFGFNGHEGLDLIPSKAGNRQIRSIEEGEVLRDVDPGERFDAYGYLTCVWNPHTRRCWWYAHNAENYVEPGQYIQQGQVIALMGGSGNVDGDHLHLGLTLTDSAKNRLNTTNGFKGFVDPLPPLEQLNKESTHMPEPTMTVERAVFEKVVSNSTKWDQTVRYVELPTDPATTSFESVQSVIGGYKARGTDLQNKVNTLSTEVTNREEQVGRLKEQVLAEQSLREDLQIKLNQATKVGGDTAAIYEGRINTLQSQVDQLAKDKGTLSIKLTAAEQKATEWQNKYTELLTTHIAPSITVFDALVILFKSFIGWAKSVQLKKEDATLNLPL